MGDQIKQVVDALTPLAGKLQQGAGEVYSIYVKQAFAVGLMETITGAVLITAPLWFLSWAWRNWDTIYKRDWEPGVVIGGVVGAIGLIGGLIMLPDGILHLLSPQYYALHELLCSVKNCSGN